MLLPRKQREKTKPVEAVKAPVEAEVAVEVPEPPKTTRPNRRPRGKAAYHA